MTSPPPPVGALRPDFLFVDVEASSLTPGFPIEVGWSDDGLRPESFLVRPSPLWDRWDWSWQSEGLHGISRERLMDEGVEVAVAARRLDDALAPATLVMSDNAGHDAKWLAMIHAAAGLTMRFEVVPHEVALACHVRLDAGNLAHWEGRFARGHVATERAFPHPHRAGPDAVALAAGFRMTVDDAYLATVEAWKEARGRGGAVRTGTLPFT